MEETEAEKILLGGENGDTSSIRHGTPTAQQEGVLRQDQEVDKPVTMDTKADIGTDKELDKTVSIDKQANNKRAEKVSKASTNTTDIGRAKESVDTKTKKGRAAFDNKRVERGRGFSPENGAGWRGSSNSVKESVSKQQRKQTRGSCSRQSDENDLHSVIGKKKYELGVCQAAAQLKDDSRFRKKNPNHRRSPYPSKEPRQRTTESNVDEPMTRNEIKNTGNSRRFSFRASLSFEGFFRSPDDLKKTIRQCLDSFEETKLNIIEESIICGEKRSACTIVFQIQADSKQIADRLRSSIYSRIRKSSKMKTDMIFSTAEEEKYQSDSSSENVKKDEVDDRQAKVDDRQAKVDDRQAKSKQVQPSTPRQGAIPKCPKNKVSATQKPHYDKQPSQNKDKNPDHIPTKLIVTIWNSFSEPREVVVFLNKVLGQKAMFFEVLLDTIEIKQAKAVCEAIASSKTSATEAKKKLNSTRIENVRISCHKACSTDPGAKAKFMKIQIQQTDTKIERKVSEALKLINLRTEEWTSDEDYDLQSLDEIINQKDEFTTRVSYIKDKLKAVDPLKATVKDLSVILSDVTTECKRLKAGLPMYARRKDIVTHVSSNQVSIILGETGSGKSTQMAQYLLEAGLADKGYIACTQPRKVAAVTLAERVAQEMGGEVGNLVGYKAGVQKAMSKNTKIIFETDHSLLNAISKDPKLTMYSCIIVDEAHERSIYTDLLLGMIKACLPERPDLKVIITSATIDPDIFIRYFNSGPELQVSGRAFPVDVIYDNTDESEDFENFESKAVSKAVEIHKNLGPGDILVFLTSSVEIMRCCQEFEKRMCGQKNFKCFPLHGQLPPDEQKKVFEHLPQGIRKIIFATNCAETSITIDGIKYVIDTGVAKEMKYDPRKNISLLNTHVISKSSADQRKGRAGRTASGKCFRLYSENGYESMASIIEPEILRVHLGQAVLKLAELGVDVKTYDFVQPPSPDAVDSAVSTLQELGALSVSGITDVGRWISKLPFDPRQGFLVYHGYKENLLYDSVVLASLISNGSNLFYKGLTESEGQHSARSKSLFSSPHGDIFAWLEVYKKWSQLPNHEKSKWCRDNSINYKIVSFTKRCIDELATILHKEMGIYVQFTFASCPKAQTSLRKIVFNAYRSTLCHSFGHQKAGYYAVVIDRQVHAHPSSCLVAQNAQPEWVVCTEFTKTSRDFIRGITVVEEQWIVEAISQEKLCIEMEAIKQKRAELIHTEEVGSVVFRKLVGPRYTRIHALETELSQDSKEAVVIEADKTCGILEVYSSSSTTEEILGHFDEFKENVLEPLKSEVLEIGIRGNITKAKCGFLVVLGQGGLVKDFFLPGQSNKVFIIKSSNDTTEDELRKKFEAFGDIKECVQFKGSDRWGFIRYESYLQAQAAIQATQNDMENVAVLPDANQSKREKPNYEAKLTWCRRPIRGSGIAFIKCSPKDRQRLIHEHIRLRGRNIMIELPNRLDSMDLVCHNTGLANEKEIEQEILALLEKDKSMEHRIQVALVRHDPKILSDADISGITEFLSGFFERYLSPEKFDIQIMTHGRHSIDQVAFVHFVDPITGFHACRELQGFIRVHDQPVEFSSSLKTRILVPKRVMDVCGANFMKLTTDLMDREDVEITTRNLKRDFAIDIKSPNVEKIIEMRRLIQQELEGKVFECEEKDNSKGLFNQQGKEFLNRLEKQCDVHIVVDHRLEKIHVHGTYDQTDEALNLMKSYLTKLGDGKHVDFSLKGSDKPAGMMKALFVKYGPLLEGLITTFNLNDVLIDFKRQKLSLIGTDKAVEETCDCLLTLQNTLAPKNYSGRQKGIPDCVVCMCPVGKEFYRLEGCGHNYCLECLKHQVTVSVNEKIFPLVCAREDCGVQLLRIELQMFLKENWITEDKLLEMSLNTFVTEHQLEYKFCSTPNCMVVYKITDDENGNEFTCPSCFVIICTSCHALGHTGLTCKMVAYKKQPDKGLEAWLDENRGKRKKCPGCNCPVEKLEGCNKMHCTSCKTFFCWVCSAVCKDEDDCYRHLRKTHGGIN